MSRFHRAEPLAVDVLNRSISVSRRVCVGKVRPVHGSMDLSANKAHERLDIIVVVDLGEASKRTARRCHSNAWYLTPFDNGDSIVHEV